MKITLKQAEIETAITMYVEGQMRPNHRREIDIDLQATRGVEGYTAVIDINENGNSYTDQISADRRIETKEVSYQEEDNDDYREVEEDAPDDSQESEEVEQTAETHEADAEAEEAPEPEPEPDPETEEVSEPEPEPAPATSSTPRKSIFANMKKPVNAKADTADKPAEAEAEAATA